MFNRTLLILSFICLISCTKEIIQQKLTVSVTPANGGSVSPPSNSYEKGSNVSLVATPSGEYLFKQWQGSISGTSNPTSITMDADKSVTGVFEKRQYPLTLTIEGSGTVKEEVLALATQSQYPSGTSVRLTAQPVYPNIFSAWSGDVSSTANPLDLIINKPISLNAIFKKINIKQTIYETSTKNHEWNNGFESRLISEFNSPPKPLYVSAYTYFDYNNDGIFDIFGRDDNSSDNIHRLHISVNDVNNNWTEVPNAIENQTFNLYRKMTSADLDNDGDLDFVGFIGEDINQNIINPHNQPAGGIDVFRNEKGILKIERIVPLGVGDEFFIHTGALADINHDGWIDIIASGGAIKIFLNDGKGNFKNQFFEAGFVNGPGEFDFHGETAVYGLEVADVNNDGFIDLLAGFARDRDSYPKLHKNLSNYSLTAHIYFGKSDYPFIKSNPYVLPTNYTSENATPTTITDFFDCTQDYAITDLNNDSYLDILTWSLNAGPSCNSAIELYQNNKDGTFTNITKSLFDKGENEFYGSGNWFKIWDIDSDGEKDILFEVTPDIGAGKTNNFNAWKKVNGKFRKTILRPVYK